MIVWVNGRLLPIEQAHISVKDRGFLLGDGVFETLYYDGQEIEGWQAHWQRLQHGLTLFQIPFLYSPQQIKEEIEQLIAANHYASQTLSIRITVTRGIGERGLLLPSSPQPTVVIQAVPYQRPATVIRLGFSDYRHPGSSALTSVKHLGYQLSVLGRLEARKKGVDDVIFLNPKEEVVGTTAANLFVLIHHQWVTPCLSSGCLPGTKRQEILKQSYQDGKEVIERPLTRQELREKGKAIFLTNSLMDKQVAYLEE